MVELEVGAYNIGVNFTERKEYYQLQFITAIKDID
jgi:hypothetical protein